jgi:hypothetical protein
MEENLFDNIYVMDATEAIEMIKSFAGTNLSSFKQDEEYNHTSGHWGITYSFQGTIIFIHSDRGYLECEMTVNGTKVLLSEFDKNLESLKVASQKNILYTLDVVKDYLEVRQ